MSKRRSKRSIVWEAYGSDRALRVARELGHELEQNEEGRWRIVGDFDEEASYATEAEAAFESIQHTCRGCSGSYPFDLMHHGDDGELYCEQCTVTREAMKGSDD